MKMLKQNKIDTDPHNNLKIDELPLDNDKKLPTLNKSEEEIKDVNSTEPEVSENFFSFFNLSSFDIPVCSEKQSNEVQESNSNIQN